VKTHALVPLNALAAAKSRLTKVLAVAEREALTLWMASRVLDAVLASRRVDAVAVVSPDPVVLEWASRRGAVALRQRRGSELPAVGEGTLPCLPGGASHEAAVLGRHVPVLRSREEYTASLPPADAGLNEGLELGRRWALAAGADALLVVLGDLPCLHAREVDDMIALADRPAGEGEAAVILAPDRRERGTNALLVRPPWLVRFTFGAQSLARHQALARYTAVEPVLYRAPGTAFDVDTPANLGELVARGLWSSHEGKKAFASAFGKEGMP
jgi:2-phospho-L-lactate/phosphoenolpyruvate guanylyltransferase